jgi:hypothetical protein
MDTSVLDLCDLVTALKAENRRIRAAASHAVDKSCESSKEDFPELGRALRKLEIELERFAPSMAKHRLLR